MAVHLGGKCAHVMLVVRYCARHREKVEKSGGYAVNSSGDLEFSNLKTLECFLDTKIAERKHHFDKSLE